MDLETIDKLNKLVNSIPITNENKLFVEDLKEDIKNNKYEEVLDKIRNANKRKKYESIETKEDFEEESETYDDNENSEIKIKVLPLWPVEHNKVLNKIINYKA